MPWFNAHASPDITWGLFWTGNLAGFVITLVVVATYLMSRSTAAALAALAWVGFLMLSNGVFHLAGALLDRSYVPGLVTAVLLYLPYSAWVGRRVVRDGAAPLAPAVVAAVLGALPMVIHGYLILFRGARLI